MTVTLRDLPDLLHDAELLGLAWQGGEIRLRYACLRGGVDDPTVELRLGGVRAVAVTFDPGRPEERPSAMVVAPELVVTLAPWTLPAREVPLVLDDERFDAELDEAARVDWLVGDRDAVRAAAWRVGLELPTGWIERTMTIACDTIEPSLPLAQWRAELGAWWQRWKEHWRDQAGIDVDAPRPPPPPPYAPPAEPRFEVGATDAPPALLALARAHFDARHAAGEWIYARVVSGWWIEGRRAHLRVEGVHHWGSEDGDAAVNRPSWWSFAFAERDGTWRSRGWSGGAIFGDELPAWASPWAGEPIVPYPAPT